MSSIYDIARQARVSPKTAARILAGGTGRPRNRERVMAAAQRLHYVRDQRAASLRSGKTGLIGLLITDISNPIASVYCRLIHDACARQGYRLLLACSYGDPTEEISTLRMLDAQRVEGLILSGTGDQMGEAGERVLESFMRRGVPVIGGGRSFARLPVDQIVIRNAHGIAKAVHYLVKTGRRRIAFVNGPESSSIAQERRQGYRQALTESGIAFDEALISHGEWTAESGAEQAAELLKRPGRPDAMVAANDLLAIGVCQAVTDGHLRAPNDVAVTGFDDIPLAEFVRPRLTTLRQPHETIVRESVQLLMQRIKTGDLDRPRRLIYEPELILRESA